MEDNYNNGVGQTDGSGGKDPLGYARIDRTIAELKRLGRWWRVIGDLTPFVEKDCKIHLTAKYDKGKDDVFIESGDRKTVVAYSDIDFDWEDGAFSVVGDNVAVRMKDGSDILLKHREKPVPDWASSTMVKAKEEEKRRREKPNQRTRPEYFRVSKMLSDVGVRINLGDNPMSYGTMRRKGLYYGYANPNTESFHTHMSKQNAEARIRGLPRHLLFDIAVKYGASVKADDVDCVAVDEKTKHLLFHLKDGRIVVFMADPMTDPDLCLTFNQDDLDRTAKVMESFNGKDGGWDDFFADMDRMKGTDGIDNMADEWEVSE